MSKYAEMIKRVTKIIKNRFPNLSTEETIDLATQIVDVMFNVEEFHKDI